MSLRGGSASVSTTSGEQTRGMERSYFVCGHFQVFFVPPLLENYHSPGTVSLFSDSFLLGPKLSSPVGCLPPNSHFCFSIGLPDIKFPCGLLTLLLFWSPPPRSLFCPISHTSPLSFHHYYSLPAFILLRHSCFPPANKLLPFVPFLVSGFRALILKESCAISLSEPHIHYSITFL